jgi:transcription antitermination factor NusG
MADEVLNKPENNSDTQDDRKWLVIYTTPRAEKKVNERLTEQDIETYLPLYTTIRQWSDRRKKVELPLFSSYIFVRVGEKERVKVLETFGVVRFLFYLRKPAVVRDKEIEAIRLFLHQTEGLKIKVEVGQKVEISAGPMEGVYGEVVRIGKEKLVLRIEQLSMSLVAEVDRGMVRHARK